MKKMQLMTALSIGVLSINLAFATPKQAVEQVRDNAGQVLNILKQANGRNDAAVRKQAEDYATPYFDFALMTRLAVGAPWNRASEAQKQTLVQEFRKMLIRVYASQMLRYKNAQVQVKDNAVAKDGGSLLRGKQIVEVRATIKPTNRWKPCSAHIKTAISTACSTCRLKACSNWWKASASNSNRFWMPKVWTA